MFYSHTCSDCQRVLTGFLPQFLVQHPEVKVQYYDNSDNQTNKALFALYNERYNRPGSPVPAIFVGDRELVGYEEITTGLESAVRDAGAQAAVSGGETSAQETVPPFPLTPFPASALFGAFTDQSPGEIAFGEPSSVPDAFWIAIPDRIQPPGDDETGYDSEDDIPDNSLGIHDFIIPATSDMIPASLSNGATFPIEFAFPDFTPASLEDSGKSPSTSMGIRLSDGSILTPFGIPDMEVVIPPAMCPTCS
jgi:hypothetical protein